MTAAPEGTGRVGSGSEEAGVEPGEAGSDDFWAFASERFLHEWAPGVLQAQNTWLSSIDSLRAPDRKTHELIRMVCTVILSQAAGVERHARLAAEVGATWDEVAGSILLTEPAFGILPATEAFPSARRGFKAGAALFAGESAEAAAAADNELDDEDEPAPGSPQT